MDSPLIFAVFILLGSVSSSTLRDGLVDKVRDAEAAGLETPDTIDNDGIVPEEGVDTKVLAETFKNRLMPGPQIVGEDAKIPENPQNSPISSNAAGTNSHEVISDPSAKAANENNTDAVLENNQVARIDGTNENKKDGLTDADQDTGVARLKTPVTIDNGGLVPKATDDTKALAETFKNNLMPGPQIVGGNSDLGKTAENTQNIPGSEMKADSSNQKIMSEPSTKVTDETHGPVTENNPDKVDEQKPEETTEEKNDEKEKNAVEVNGKENVEDTANLPVSSDVTSDDADDNEEDGDDVFDYEYDDSEEEYDENNGFDEDTAETKDSNEDVKNFLKQKNPFEVNDDSDDIYDDVEGGIQSTTPFFWEGTDGSESSKAADSEGNADSYSLEESDENDEDEEYEDEEYDEEDFDEEDYEYDDEDQDDFDLSDMDVDSDEDVDAGKDMMQSSHHFDSNLGPLAGVKVSSWKNKDTASDWSSGQMEMSPDRSIMSVYGWILMLTLAIVAILLVFVWKRSSVEKYIVSLRSPRRQYRRVKDEEDNLMDNQYS